MYSHSHACMHACLSQSLTYMYIHTSYQSISLRKCGISEDPLLYYLAEVIDSSKGEERELKPDEHPYDIAYKGHGILKLYIR